MTRQISASLRYRATQANLCPETWYLEQNGVIMHNCTYSSWDRWAACQRLDNRTDNCDNREDEKCSGTYRLGISQKSPTPELLFCNLKHTSVPTFMQNATSAQPVLWIKPFFLNLFPACGWTLMDSLTAAGKAEMGLGKCARLQSQTFGEMVLLRLLGWQTIGCVILNVGAAVGLMLWGHWSKCRVRSNGYLQDVYWEAL